MAIRKLEHNLSLTLFQRHERTPTLTDEGHTLYERARELLALAEQTEVQMKEIRGLTQGTLRIAVPSMLGSYYLPPILMGFRHRYPDLKLSVMEAGADTIRQQLHNGEVDLGVIASNELPDDLETLTLLQLPMKVILAQDHPLAARESIDFEEFFAEDLAVFNSGYFHRETLEKIATAHGMSLNISFEANLIPLIKQVVRHGFGISTLLEMVIAEDQDLVARPFTEPVMLNLGLAWRKGGYLSKANTAFVHYLAEMTGVDPATVLSENDIVQN